MSIVCRRSLKFPNKNNVLHINCVEFYSTKFTHKILIMNKNYSNCVRLSLHCFIGSENSMVSKEETTGQNQRRLRRRISGSGENGHHSLDSPQQAGISLHRRTV